jgi:para-nitrobenzyl esterase
MKQTPKFIAFLILMGMTFSISCGSDNQRKSNLKLEFSPPPISLNGIEADFAADVSYGDDPLSTFDIFIPRSNSVKALVIFTHGGGFHSGDKSAIYSTGEEDIRFYLEHNIAFATLNYRFRDDFEDGVLGCMNEIKFALQFMRFYHGDLKINPSKIGMYGGSAGGGASIWLGFKDDMADPYASDPVEKESTRLQAIGHLTSQSTYDPIVMEEQIFDPVGVDLFSLQNAQSTVLDYYNIQSLDELTTNPKLIEIREDLNILGWLSSDDPEFFTANSNSGDDPIRYTDASHHPLQAKALVDKATAVGVLFKADVPSQPSIPVSDETLNEYMVRKLQ